jgi:hypothetical protein
MLNAYEAAQHEQVRARSRRQVGTVVVEDGPGLELPANRTAEARTCNYGGVAKALHRG